MDTNEHGEPARTPGSALAKRPEPLEMPVAPVADIYETADAFVIKLDLPGAVKGSISVRVEPGVLSVKGKVTAHHGERSDLLFNEILRKSYFRSFNLGEGVDRNNIQAMFLDGVLEITIPKTDAMKAREIEIK
jgi:HSP20 family protein